jgi:RHS repeat-associated protein
MSTRVFFRKAFAFFTLLSILILPQTPLLNIYSVQAAFFTKPQVTLDADRDLYALGDTVNVNITLDSNFDPTLHEVVATYPNSKTQVTDQLTSFISFRGETYSSIQLTALQAGSRNFNIAILNISDRKLITLERLPLEVIQPTFTFIEPEQADIFPFEGNGEMEVELHFSSPQTSHTLNDFDLEITQDGVDLTSSFSISSDSATATFTGQIEGEAEFEAFLLDPTDAHLYASTTRNYNLINDETEPVITIENLTDGEFLNVQGMSIRGGVEEDHLASFTFNGEEKGAINQFQIPHTFEEGENTLDFTATDKAGWTSTQSLTITADFTAPEVEITSPQARSAHGSCSSIAFEASTDDKDASHWIEVRSPWNPDHAEDNDGLGYIMPYNSPSIDLFGNVTQDIALVEGQNIVELFAKDEAGNLSRSSQILYCDETAPSLQIHTPYDGESIYQGEANFLATYRDHFSEIEESTFTYTFTDESEVDVTSSITVSDLSTSDSQTTATFSGFTEEESYTLSVSIQDEHANEETKSINFYVAPSAITPPSEANEGGRIHGTIFTTLGCAEDIYSCEGLEGAQVTLLNYEGEEIEGTIISGPEGKFSFPTPETNEYWLTAEKEGFTYAQRILEVVKNGTASAAFLHLTPLQEADLYDLSGVATTSLDASGGSAETEGTEEDGDDWSLEVIFPAGAIAEGQSIDELNFTWFERADFLPGGGLPPGTAETFAFDISGSDPLESIEFEEPVTVRFKDTRSFSSTFEDGEIMKIPVGYWNSETQEWEHVSTSYAVDEDGDGITDFFEYETLHFSPHDPNAPPPTTEYFGDVANSPESKDGDGANGNPNAPQGTIPPPPTPPEPPHPCKKDNGNCTVGFDSGDLNLFYQLPKEVYLGQPHALSFTYSSASAQPKASIATSTKLDGDNIGEFDSLEWQLNVGGESFDPVFFEVEGEGDYLNQYLYDAKDAHENRLETGIYEAEVDITVNYTGQYYYTIDGIFGGDPDLDRPTGTIAQGEYEETVTSTFSILNLQDSPFGSGWNMDGLQELHENEEGYILITEGQSFNEYYFPNKNLLPNTEQDLQIEIDEGEDPHIIVSNHNDDSLSFFYQSSTESEEVETLEVGAAPWNTVITQSGDFAFVSNSDEDTVTQINLEDHSTKEITVGDYPYAMVISPDDLLLYVASADDDSISIIDVTSGTNLETDIPTGDYPFALEMDDAGETLIIANLQDDSVTFYDIETEVASTVSVGNAPYALELNADDSELYVSNLYDQSISVLDTDSEAELTEIAVGDYIQQLKLSAGGLYLYALSTADEKLYVYNTSGDDIYTEHENFTLGGTPQAMVEDANGEFLYIANSDDDNLTVIEIGTILQETDSISVGDYPVSLVSSADGENIYVSNYNGESVSIIDVSDASVESTFTVGDGPIHVNMEGSAYREVEPTIYNLNDNDYSSIDYDPTSETYSRHYTSGRVVQFNTDGKQESSTDRLGNAWNYSYSNGLLTQVTLIAQGDSSGPSWTLTYEEDQLTSIENPSGLETFFTINSKGDLIQLENPSGDSRQFTYDAEHLALTKTYETGETTSYRYSELGLIESVLSPSREIYGDDGLEIDQELRSYSPADASQLLNDPDNPLVSDADNLAALTGASEVLSSSTDGGGNEWIRVTNAYGSVIEESDPLGRTTIYDRDEEDNLIQITYPEGNASRYSYDSEGYLLTFSRLELPIEEGEELPTTALTTTYTYEDNFHLIASITDANDEVITHTYDALGNLEKTTYPEVAAGIPEESYTYSSSGQLESVTDANGTVSKLEYNSDHFLIKITEDFGGLNLLTEFKDYNDFGSFESMIDPNGNETNYEYDADDGMLTAEILNVDLDQDGSLDTIRTEYLYDERNNLIEQIDDAGGDLELSITLLYDAHNQVLSKVQTETNTGNAIEVKRAYDVNRNLIHESDGEGNIIFYEYDAANQLISTSNGWSEDAPDGLYKESYTYTENGLLESKTLPNASVLWNEYDVYDRLETKVKDLNGLALTTQYSYDNKGNLLTETSADDAVTQYTYDALDRQLTETQDLNGFALEMTQEYDLLGNVTMAENVRGIRQTADYDALNRVETFVDDFGGLNLSISYDYDSNGNLTQVEDYRGVITTHDYDERNLRTSTSGDVTGLNLTSHQIYNAFGQAISLSDPKAQITEWEKDAFGNTLSQVIDPSGENITSIYLYDKNFNRILAEDSLGNQTHYQYDALNRELEQSFPDSTTQSIIYSEEGGIASEVNRAGEIVTHENDSLYRLSELTFVSGETQTFTYDEMGRILTAEDSANESLITQSYNALGELTSSTQEFGSLSAALTYDYEHEAGEKTINYPNGESITSSLDALQRLDTLVDSGGSTLVDYDYDDLSSTWDLIFGNAITTFHEQDSLGRITQIQSSLADYHYSYDDAGNIAATERAHLTGDNYETYEYDAANRLSDVYYQADSADYASVTSFADETNYSLDALGNRTQYAVNELNQYTEFGGHSLEYNARGSLISDGENTYDYDELNRLTLLTDSLGNETNYFYDAFSRRIAKEQDGSRNFYVYEKSNVIEEQDGSGTLEKSFVHGAGTDEPLFMTDHLTAADYYYHSDSLGSITEISGSTGALVEAYEYEVYGQPTIYSDSARSKEITHEDSLQQPYLFTARRYDSESENYYYRARYHDPKLGRFLSPDPLDYIDSMNVYAYVDNNPINYVDPTGESMAAISDAFRMALPESGSVSFNKELNWWAGELKLSLSLKVSNQNCCNERSEYIRDGMRSFSGQVSLSMGFKFLLVTIASVSLSGDISLGSSTCGGPIDTGGGCLKLEPFAGVSASESINGMGASMKVGSTISGQLCYKYNPKKKEMEFLPDLCFITEGNFSVSLGKVNKNEGAKSDLGVGIGSGNIELLPTTKSCLSSLF